MIRTILIGETDALMRKMIRSQSIMRSQKESYQDWPRENYFTQAITIYSLLEELLGKLPLFAYSFEQKNMINILIVNSNLHLLSFC